MTTSERALLEMARPYVFHGEHGQAPLSYCPRCGRRGRIPRGARVCGGCVAELIDRALGRPVAVRAWAKNHDCCIACGTTERRHHAYGLCVECFTRSPRKLRGLGL